MVKKQKKTKIKEKSYGIIIYWKKDNKQEDMKHLSKMAIADIFEEGLSHFRHPELEFEIIKLKKTKNA